MQPEQFGRYTLLSRLGYGGMAEVFLARTGSIGGFEKILAIKRLLPSSTEDQQTVDLLSDEAKITVHLTHPNIVQVFDFGCVEQTYYIAMEYVDGLDLKSLIALDDDRSEALSLEVALYIVTSVLDALDFAHHRTDASGTALGIIHRDVSPHNVLISRHGQVKLADFGVARAAISSHVSIVGDIRGKFSYMPPEQACGGEIDHRVDIFAASAILYELLSGRQPFRSASSTEQMSLLRHAVEPPSRLRAGISADLDAITVRALDKDPERRFPTAKAFASALRRHLEQLLGGADPLRAMQALAELVERRLGDEGLREDSAPVLPIPSLPSQEHSLLMSLDDFTQAQDSLIGDALGHSRLSRVRAPSGEGPTLAASAHLGDATLVGGGLHDVPSDELLTSVPTNVVDFMPSRRAREPERAPLLEAPRQRPTRSEVADAAVTPAHAAPGVGKDGPRRTRAPTSGPAPHGEAQVHDARRRTRVPEEAAPARPVAPARPDPPTDPENEPRPARTRRPASDRRLLRIAALCALLGLGGTALAIGIWLSRKSEVVKADAPDAALTQLADLTVLAKAKADAGVPDRAAPVDRAVASADSGGPDAGAVSVPIISTQPVPRRPPRRPPRRGHGLLSVNAAPGWGYVYIGNHRVGATPLLRHRLSAGRHRVRVLFKPRRFSPVRTVVIRPGRTTKLVVRMR